MSFPLPAIGEEERLHHDRRRISIALFQRYIFALSAVFSYLLRILLGALQGSRTPLDYIAQLLETPTDRTGNRTSRPQKFPIRYLPGCTT